MYYIENNKKIPSSSFKEGFNFGYAKNNSWKWWLMILLIIIVLILLVWWFIKKNGNNPKVGYRFL